MTYEYRRALYYISDGAYDNLWRKAVAARYIGRGAATGKGIAAYITELSKCVFGDFRPDDVRNSDSARIANGLTLYWDDGDNRKARTLTLDDDVIDRLCAIAVQFRIGIGKAHKNNNVILRSDTVTIAKVLEAIGLGWLQPLTDVPTKPQKEKKRENSK